MPRFFFRYQSNTLFSLGTRQDHAKGECKVWKFNINSHEIAVYEILKEIGQLKVCTGLGLDIYIQENDPDVALGISIIMAYNLLGLMCYSSLTVYRPPRLIARYEADENLETRQLEWYFYPGAQDEIAKSLRRIDTKIFCNLWDAYKNNLVKPSVIHAIYQLCKAFIADDSDTKFIEYWRGLEYLVAIFDAQFIDTRSARYPICRACGIKITNCPFCKAETELKKPEKGHLTSIEQVLEKNFGVTKKDFDKLYKIRSVLMKSGHKESVPGYYREIPRLRFILVSLIGAAINLNKQTIELISKMEPLEAGIMNSENKIIQKTDITGLVHPPYIEDFTKQPRIDIKQEALEYEINKDNTLQVKGRFKYTIFSGSDVRFKIKSFE